MARFRDKPKYLDKMIKKLETPLEMLNLAEKIKDITSNESIAILCASSNDESYGTIVTFALSDDLKYAVFATPEKTKKYSQISKSSQVALVVDNRMDFPESINEMSGITILGNAAQVKTDYEKWKNMLLEKHPYFDEFLEAPSTILVLMEVKQYVYVENFQEVRILEI